jgi:predicted transcriptional regulator
MTEKSGDFVDSPHSEIQPPSEAEFQVLSALWQHKTPVGLQEICETVRERLSLTGASAPATTTISTYVRRLIDKGLVRARSVGPVPKLRVGLLAPRAKPRFSMYEPTCEPSELMSATFDTLIQAYHPDERNTRPLNDLIQALKLPPEKANVLRCVIEHEGDSTDLLGKLVEQLPLDESKRRILRSAISTIRTNARVAATRSARK